MFCEKSVFVCLGDLNDFATAVVDGFAGRVFRDAGKFAEALRLEPDLPPQAVFVGGDVARVRAAMEGVDLVGGARRYQVVRELSRNYDEDAEVVVPLAAMPVHVRGVGVYYPCVFADHVQCFRHVMAAHAMHDLTESTKPSAASCRKGVYITEVSRVAGHADALRFKLLRCSTNFAAPTDNLAVVDEMILSTVNELVALNFAGASFVNHVLAQLCTNSAVDGKEKKARIPAHSVKTKDMPANAVFAFVTFYDADVSVPEAMACLVWKSKTDADAKPVEVLLRPGSVLLVSMDTNRLWSHEVLSPSRVPTRLGYVARCSKTDAVWKDGTTFVHTSEDGVQRWVAMREPTPEDAAELKEHCRLENAGTRPIVYTSATHGSVIPYSLNAGDYMRPRLRLFADSCR